MILKYISIYFKNNIFSIYIELVKKLNHISLIHKITHSYICFIDYLKLKYNNIFKESSARKNNLDLEMKDINGMHWYFIDNVTKKIY
jgi:hypothetical protein